MLVITRWYFPGFQRFYFLEVANRPCDMTKMLDEHVETNWINSLWWVFNKKWRCNNGKYMGNIWEIISFMEFCWFYLKWSESMFLNQPSSKVCLKIKQHQAASTSHPTSRHNFPGPGLQDGGSDGHIDIEGAKDLVQSPNLTWTKSGVAVCCSK